MPASTSVQAAAQQQIQRFQEAMLLNACIDKLPEVLAVIDQYDLERCCGPEQAALQQMLDKTFAMGNRHQLAVSDVSQHLASIQGICGVVSPIELQLFGAAKHCDAFFNFMEEQQFFGK